MSHQRYKEPQPGQLLEREKATRITYDPSIADQAAHLEALRQTISVELGRVQGALNDLETNLGARVLAGDDIAQLAYELQELRGTAEVLEAALRRINALKESLKRSATWLR